MTKKKKKGNNLGLGSLGKLEMEIMPIVWQRKQATVKDVFEILWKKRGLAYTTIMTVMGRLAAKGFLKQDKSTIPYLYTAIVSKEKMALAYVDEVVEKMLDGGAGLLASYLIEKKQIGKEELEHLRKTVRKKSESVK